jgi:N-acetyl-gamma-glutamyl-phosphate/LysW-gamma-L-alpha-aminoadipyl-6-phosphate reductase
MKDLRVGVLGGAGLLGVQLIAMLHGHPAVREVVPFSRRVKGLSFGAAFPAFHHMKSPTFRDPAEAVSAGCDVVFLALPHGESFAYVESLAQAGARLIDLSADFRLRDPALFEAIYRRPHGAPQRLADFVLVVPEINGAVLERGPRFVAVPGCTATAMILALHPLISAGLLSSPVVIGDAKTSSSGAGTRSGEASQSHVQRAHGVRVHKLLDEHRHRYEVAAFLEESAGMRLTVLLSTYAVDLVRGLSCSCYVDLREGVDAKALYRTYRAAYAEAPCVRIVRLNAGVDRFPNPKATAYTAFCDVGFHVAGGKGVLIASLDNLLKGGAAQAMQCFNRMVGVPETTGLPLTGHFP